MIDPYPQRPPLRMGWRRGLARIGVGLLWCVVMLGVFAVAVFGAMAGATYLGHVLRPGLDGDRDFGTIRTAAALAGIVAASVVCHLARGWVQQARLRQMRQHHTSATARVVWSQAQYSPGGKGPAHTLYTIYLSWQDTAGEHTGERQYRFFNHGPDDFTARFAVGASLPIRYPVGRPQRFIIDTAYAPTMADLFI